jgi:hypothetical protein
MWSRREVLKWRVQRLNRGQRNHVVDSRQQDPRHCSSIRDRRLVDFRCLKLLLEQLQEETKYPETEECSTAPRMGWSCSLGTAFAEYEEREWCKSGVGESKMEATSTASVDAWTKRQVCVMAFVLGGVLDWF